MRMKNADSLLICCRRRLIYATSWVSHQKQFSIKRNKSKREGVRDRGREGERSNDMMTMDDPKAAQKYNYWIWQKFVLIWTCTYGFTGHHRNLGLFWRLRITTMLMMIMYLITVLCLPNANTQVKINVFINIIKTDTVFFQTPNIQDRS